MILNILCGGGGMITSDDEEKTFMLSVYYKLKCTQVSWWSDCGQITMLHQKLKRRIYILYLYKCIWREGDTDRTCSHSMYLLFILLYICWMDRTFSLKFIEWLDKNWIIDKKKSQTQALFTVTRSPSRSCSCWGFDFTLRASMLT